MADAGSTIAWLETWNAQVSTIVGAFASLCGVFVLFAAGASCKFAGLLQIVTGLIVVAIEGPNFLPQLAFAAPAGMFFEGKPAWAKVALYAALTIIPAFAGCFKAFLLGFIASAIVTGIHALLLMLGRRTSPDEMRFQGGPPGGPGGPTDQAYSPTSPWAVVN